MQECTETRLAHVEAAYRIQRLSDPAYVSRVADGFEACVSQGSGLVVRGDAQAIVEAIHNELGTEMKDPVEACLRRFPSVGYGLALAVGAPVSGLGTPIPR